MGRGARALVRLVSGRLGVRSRGLVGGWVDGCRVTRWMNLWVANLAVVSIVGFLYACLDG